MTTFYSRILLLNMLLFGILVSCKEESIIEENPSTEQENNSSDDTESDDGSKDNTDETVTSTLTKGDLTFNYYGAVVDDIRVEDGYIGSVDSLHTQNISYRLISESVANAIELSKDGEITVMDKEAFDYDNLSSTDAINVAPTVTWRKAMTATYVGQTETEIDTAKIEIYVQDLTESIEFKAQIANHNEYPFTGYTPSNTSILSKPCFGDVDGDNDLDLLLAQTTSQYSYSFIQRLENDNNSFSNVANLSLPAGTNGAASLAIYAAPALCDYDNDGDEDLFVVRAYGQNAIILLYEKDSNSGSYTRNFNNNPFTQNIAINATTLERRYIEMGGLTASGITFEDIDGDGDKDFVRGHDNGTFGYYQNNGDGTFTAAVQNGVANPFAAMMLPYTAASNSSNPQYRLSVPAFADIDNDGDQDLISGCNNGTLFLYRNDGNGNYINPGAANTYAGIDVGISSAPAFTDVNGDGVIDMVVGEGHGILNYYVGSYPTPSRAYIQFWLSELSISEILAAAAGN